MKADRKKPGKNKKLDKTPLGRLAIKYGHNSLRKACNEVDNVKGRDSYSSIQKYLSGLSKKFNKELIPYLLQVLDGCTEEELKQAIRDSKNNNYQNNLKSEEKEIEISRFNNGAITVEVDTANSVDYSNTSESSEIELEYLQQGYKFVISRMITVAKYDDDRTLSVDKKLVIKALEDNLYLIPEIAHYRVVREKDSKEPEFSCSNNIEAQKIWRNDGEENYIDITFKTPPNKGQEIEISFYYKFEKVVYEDSTFHYIKITAPTLYMLSMISPPSYVTKGYVVSLTDYAEESLCRRNRGGKPVKELELTPSRIYLWEQVNPKPDHCYKIDWKEVLAIAPINNMSIATVEKYEFVALEVDTHTADIYRNGFGDYQEIRIKSLIDGLEQIEDLKYTLIEEDDYRLDHLVELKDKNCINIHFNEPLRKYQEVKLVLYCGYVDWYFSDKYYFFCILFSGELMEIRAMYKGHQINDLKKKLYSSFAKEECNRMAKVQEYVLQILAVYGHKEDDVVSYVWSRANAYCQ